MGNLFVIPEQKLPSSSLFEAVRLSDCLLFPSLVYSVLKIFLESVIPVIFVMAKISVLHLMQ